MKQMMYRWRRWIGTAMLFVLMTVSVLSPQKAYGAENSPDLDTVISSVSSYILNKDKNPDLTSCWNMVGLKRSGVNVPKSYADNFYKNAIIRLKEKNWVLTRTKYSEYSKLIITLTAMGKDAKDIMGHNLLAYLSDMQDVTRQGTNGPIWALMALKSHPTYEIPTNPLAKEQTTEEGLIQYILGREIKSTGGWSLDGITADSDLTGMAIQALSSYYGKRPDVTAAIDRALLWLSTEQFPSGGFGTINPGTGEVIETSESVCQVIVALSALKIDCRKDSRFIKNGKSPLDGLLQYYLPEGGFMHVAANASNNGGGEPGALNGMATEQGLYTTTAYKRLIEGKTFLYDMSDMTLTKGEEPKGAEGTSGQQEEPETEPQKVKVIGLVLDYKSITLGKGKSKTLKVTITPSNASNKKVKWTSSNEKVAKVSTKGKVTGKKAGTAKITVTALDGSKKKAVCTVKVKGKASTKQLGTTGTTKAKTKTLPQTTRTKTTQSSSKSTNKKKDSSSKSTEADTTEGWSFSGEEYIPESGEEEVAESTEEEKVPAAVSPISAHLPYVMMGCGGTATIGVIFWLFQNGTITLPRRNKKTRKQRIKRGKRGKEGNVQA